MEAQKLAEPGTEDSWKPAVVKYDEALKLFVEHLGPDKRSDAGQNFVAGLRPIAPRVVQAKSFPAANRCYTYALAKAHRC